MKAVASPFNLFGTPTTVDRPPPGLGAETDEILRDFGLSRDDIAALRVQGYHGETHRQGQGAVLPCKLSHFSHLRTFLVQADGHSKATS